MRILQVVHSLPFLNQAGTEIYAYNLCLELSKRHQVYVFARTCNEKQKDYEITKDSLGGITAYLINNTFRNCGSFEMYYQNGTIDEIFSGLLDEIEPDVVHIHHLIFLSTGIIKKIYDRGIPIIFTLHDYWLMCPRWHLLKKDLKPCDKAPRNRVDEECITCLAELLNIKKGAKRIYALGKTVLPGSVVRHLKRIYLLFMRVSNSNNGILKLKARNYETRDCLDKVKTFLSPSTHLRDRFIEFGIPEDKIKLSRNGLDTCISVPQEKTRSGGLRFAFIGTILPAKGLHVLINSFNKIRAGDAELRIYGKLYQYAGFEYYLPYLKKITKNKNIRFMGEVDHRQIPGIFRGIDVLVVPSIWEENSPLVIEEAFLHKTPVLASRIGGIPELVRHEENGLLFEPGDQEDLYNKMSIFINNPGLVDVFSKRIVAPKSIQENALEIEKLYIGGRTT